MNTTGIQKLHRHIFMAEVKFFLGWREFDVDCEEIDAISCDVSAADCAALAARMKTGEINKLKKLFLVCLRLICVFALYVLRMLRCSL